MTITTRHGVWLLLALLGACGADDHDHEQGHVASGGRPGAAGGSGAGVGGVDAGGTAGGDTSGAGVAGAGASTGIAGAASEGGGGGLGLGGAAGGGGVGGAADAGTAGAAAGESTGGQSSADELENIFNLVDPAAVAELEAFLVAEVSTSSTALARLPLCVNGFLERYREEYDFLFFMLDHVVPNGVPGAFDPVNQEIMPGTGRDIRFRRPGYKTNGRVKGAAGFELVPGGYGPYAHQMLHYWAIAFDVSFGFYTGGLDLRFHWGYGDVHGQLGGYDPTHFECQTPAGALPPSCTATIGGLYRYVTSPFSPSGAVVDIPYAPFELYLMGLLPRAQAPATIHLLDMGRQVSSGTSVVLEARGIKAVSVDDIVAVHGEVEPLPVGARAFKAAMIVVSERPASAAVLGPIAHAMAAFGNRTNDATLPSFEKLTGGRATLDTRLGPPRLPSDGPATETPLPECDVLAQDCDPAWAGCYLAGQHSFCARPRGRQRGEACGDESHCAPGLGCKMGSTVTGAFCEPYCDSENTSSPIACAKLCPNQYIRLGRSDGSIIAGSCVAP